MKNWIELAKQILQNHSQLHVRDIAKEAIKLDSSVGSNIEDVMNKFSSSLASNVKSKNPIFKKINNKSGGFKKGFYSLKKKPMNPLVKNNNSTYNSEVKDSLYIGKAGEYAVLSELMFRGYNSTILPVDNGIDVVAQKENKYYHIQVKTSCIRKNTNFSFSIKNSSFEAKNYSETYYIFVLRHENKNRKINDFAIFHTREIQGFFNDYILTKKDSISVKIKIEKDKYILGESLRNKDITHNINNFNIL